MIFNNSITEILKEIVPIFKLNILVSILLFNSVLIALLIVMSKIFLGKSWADHLIAAFTALNDKVPLIWCWARRAWLIISVSDVTLGEKNKTSVDLVHCSCLRCSNFSAHWRHWEVSNQSRVSSKPAHKWNEETEKHWFITPTLTPKR